MNKPLTYKEFSDLNEEYILDKLKQGKSTEQIKNEFAIENSLLDKMYGNKTGGKNKFASAFETTLYRKIKEDKELNSLNETIKKNQDVNLNLNRLKKFYKDNISNYTDAKGTIKKGTVENLNQDALEYFKNNYPGSVSTYLAKKGGSGKLSPNAEYIRLAKGPSATESSFQRGRQLIRNEIEKYMPSSVGSAEKVQNKFERLQRREQTAAETLGMTKEEYKNLINRLVVYPVRKLFPSLTSTPYSAGAEHVYGLQQAISTNMLGEIKKSALNVVPSPKDFNRLIKGPQLDLAATGLIKNAYQTAEVEKKQMYLDKANELIDDFKKDFPGDYPKYKLTSKNNIVDVNLERVNRIKEPLFNKASTYIDYLVKTPGFLESNEFSNLPDTAKEIINAKVSKSKSFGNLLKAGIKKGGALAVAPAAAYLGYEALSPSAAEAKTPTGEMQTAIQDQTAETQPEQSIEQQIAEATKPKLYFDKDLMTFMKDPETPADQSDKLYWLADNPIAENSLAITAGLTAGLAIPGAKETYEASRAAGRGPTRSAAGVALKGLGRAFTPLPVAAMDAAEIGSRVAKGESASDILTSPTTYMNLAFLEGLPKTPGQYPSAGALGKVKDFFNLKNVSATAEPGIMSAALRMGLSPRVIAGAGRFLGIPGLIASSLYTGYDMYNEYKENKKREELGLPND